MSKPLNHPQSLQVAQLVATGWGLGEALRWVLGGLDERHRPPLGEVAEEATRALSRRLAA
jgi:hypothetical protein